MFLSPISQLIDQLEGHNWSINSCQKRGQSAPTQGWNTSTKHSFESDDTSHSIRVSLPGHDKSTVDITVKDTTIIVKAESPASEHGSLINNETYTFRLPKDANSSAIDAQITNGILTVTFPRMIDQPLNRKIIVS